MTDPSLIERLHKPERFIRGNLASGFNVHLDDDQARLLADMISEAASTLEDQARLIGECREVVENARWSLNQFAAIVPGNGWDNEVAEAKESINNLDALLTKLKASVDGATK